jgi:DNA-binding SARP family transcriptional activator/ABC-type branched-subunit amino acid transport system ATPase component
MSHLKLFLLGPPRLDREGEPLEINTRKSMALMAYLAVTGQAHRREALTTLLWPNSPARQARAILRTTLSGLNKILAGEGLVVERDSISLDAERGIWLDVEAFQQLAHSWQSHDHPEAELCEACLTQLAEAVALYRGDFLEGFTLRDSATFDDWQAFETERFRRELAAVLEKLVAGHRAQDHFEAAIAFAQHWLALDPLHEPAYRWLMQLYAESGNRSAALRQYQTCYELLEDELEVRPEAETTALYERIRQETAQHVKMIIGSYGIVEGNTPEGLAKNLLGQGGMGNVYRGLDTQSGEPVAIKVLKPEVVAANPDLVERFVREGEALRQLNHPNIVKLFAAAEQDDHHYLVMEYVDGSSLQELLKQENLLPISRVLEIALDLADALTRAHRLNIIHRDLKPANILMAANGTPRLTDFGIARLVDSPQLTATGLLVGTLNYLSPEGYDGQTLDERADIWAFGVVLFEMLSGKQPFTGETMTTVLAAIMTQPTPDLNQYRSDIPPPLADLIYRMLLKEREQRIPSVRLVGAELEAIMAKRPMTPTTPLAGPVGPPPACPYRGLLTFLEEDAPFFFGREMITATLVEAVQQRGVVAVIGPSGSGKSSVVQAGLVAELRQGPGWLIEDFRPGSDPFQALAATLLPLLEPELSITAQLVEVRKLVESLIAGDLPLADVVDRILQQADDATRLLLVVDQFEELYTLCPDPEIRYSFMDMLFEVIDLQQYQTRPTFTLVFTLRADFLEQALAHRPFADVIQDNDFKLGPMTREELGLTIERPAEMQEVTFESGLVERILDDVGEEPGNLPLLEFALTMLWERLSEQQSRQLTHVGYETIGGVEGALTRHADAIYTKLSSTEQETARRLFTQMVRLGERTEDTRRLALRTELNEEDWQMAQRLADARLVVTGRDATGRETVEVAHEALIRNWARLRHWLDTDREFLFWQQRLRNGLRQWTSSDHDEGALLRGAPLAEAENWLNQRRMDLSEAEREFIQAGLALRERQAAEREAQLRRELEIAQALATEAEARRIAEEQHAQEAEARAQEQAQAATNLRKRAVWVAVLARPAASRPKPPRPKPRQPNRKPNGKLAGPEPAN